MTKKEKVDPELLEDLEDSKILVNRMKHDGKWNKKDDFNEEDDDL